MLNQRVIQFASLLVIGAGALAMPSKATARAQACEGQTFCVESCPGNLTLFCQSMAGCTPDPYIASCGFEWNGCGVENAIVYCSGVV